MNESGGRFRGLRDCFLCVLPLWHMNAQVVTLLATLASGSSVVVPRRFAARDFWLWVIEREFAGEIQGTGCTGSGSAMTSASSSA